MLTRSEQLREVRQALGQVERAMRELKLWQPEPPSAAALASEQPFAVDALAFHQWLQFIFIPKMTDLVDHNRPLPTSCAITPMAEEMFKGDGRRVACLIEQLRKLDNLLTLT